MFNSSLTFYRVVCSNGEQSVVRASTKFEALSLAAFQHGWVDSDYDRYTFVVEVF